MSRLFINFRINQMQLYFNLNFNAQNLQQQQKKANQIRNGHMMATMEKDTLLQMLMKKRKKREFHRIELIAHNEFQSVFLDLQPRIVQLPLIFD